MGMEQNPTEFFASMKERNSRARQLRQEGWIISVGRMRRKDGKDFYVRAWRRSLTQT